MFVELSRCVSLHEKETLKSAQIHLEGLFPFHQIIKKRNDSSREIPVSNTINIRTVVDSHGTL